ncbi:MAG: Glutamine--fructose-6-phosphate aminotransferase, partial [Verrucomicrobiota bacterium]
MCGIIGYIGKKQASPILLDALLRLEYRGYDSAGVSVLREGDLQVVKRKGKIAEGLGKALAKKKVQGHVGVGHTRWATHGAPCDENSHPHLDQKAQLAIVHNGVIENYDTLKERMLADGHVFHSATDTEVFAHLIGEHYDKVKKAGGSSADVHPLAQAVTNAIKEVTGAFGIAVVCKDFPDVIVGARRGSPLIVGVGEGENFLASDATAIAQYTRQVIYLNENDLVTLSAKDFKVV